MGSSAIADVLIKMIFWVFGGEVNHILVASDFGDDGRGGDFTDFVVGLDEGGDVILEWGIGKKINTAVNNNLGKRGVK